VHLLIQIPLVLLLAAPAAAQLIVNAPPALRPAAERIERVDLNALADDLRRAGLVLPPQVRVTLIAADDPRAAGVPAWIVGLALGGRDIVIFPGRVLSYPYDSLESVVRHEITHLALTARAGGQPLPRWFHEGVATTVDAGWSIGAQLRLVGAMLEGPDTAGLADLFASDSESATREAYLLAAVLVEDLRRRHGSDVPGRIAAGVAAGVPFDRAFQEQTRESPDAAAARAWAAYLRWTQWLPAVTGASAMWAVILVLAFVAYATQMRRRFQRRAQWEEDD
jgi:hypothetical protein